MILQNQMETNKTTYISILFAIILIIGAIFFTGKNNSDISKEQEGNNVSIVDGKQVITINAKGGYAPRITSAKANMPTIIKVATNGTFDCSSAISIPSIGYRNILPQTGETLIDVSPQKPGTKMQGLCSMGMYNFSIEFN